MDTYNAVLTTLSKTIRQKARKHPAQGPKRRTNMSFKEKFFSQVFHLDFVGEWSIDDPGKNFLPGSR